MRVRLSLSLPHTHTHTLCVCVSLSPSLSHTHSYTVRALYTSDLPPLSSKQQTPHTTLIASFCSSKQQTPHTTLIASFCSSGLFVKHGWTVPAYHVLGAYAANIGFEGDEAGAGEKLHGELQIERYTYRFGILDDGATIYYMCPYVVCPSSVKESELRLRLPLYQSQVNVEMKGAAFEVADTGPHGANTGIDPYIHTSARFDNLNDNADVNKYPHGPFEADLNHGPYVLFMDTLSAYHPLWWCLSAQSLCAAASLLLYFSHHFIFLYSLFFFLIIRPRGCTRDLIRSLRNRGSIHCRHRIGQLLEGCHPGVVFSTSICGYT